MRKFSTPMMQQYVQIKDQYPDALLFFRLGDFYELFLDDAEVGSKVLGITLTQRPRGKDGHIPMAGVPFHAADAHIAKLTQAGYRIAICEQTSPADTKKLVDRSVVRIISPGVYLDDNYLESGSNNYVAVVTISPIGVGLAVADVTTGDFRVTEIRRDERVWQRLGDELARWRPTECVIDSQNSEFEQLKNVISSHSNIQVTHFSEWSHFSKNSDSYLREIFGTSSLEVFQIADKTNSTQSAAILLGFLEYTQQSPVTHLQKITYYNVEQYLQMDRATVQNLELFETLRTRDRVGSLLHTIDRTQTAMGARKLRSWLAQPLTSKSAIEYRLEAVSLLSREQILAKELGAELESMYDIERIVSRLAVGMGSGARLVQLQTSLEHTQRLQKILTSHKKLPKLLKASKKQFSNQIKKIIQYIDAHISREKLTERQEIGIIRSGVSTELDSLREVLTTRSEWLENFEKQERKRSGISSLKCKFNKVFGFYIEVSKSNLDAVPEDYIRKQTLVNAERFITPELKEHEELVLTAEEKIEAIERRIYEEVVEWVMKHSGFILDVANSVAELDCVLGLSVQARQARYVMPEITSNGQTTIVAGRHPMVEATLKDVPFVPNDTKLNADDHQLLVITGPNMAGKSVYMRQVAVITLLAHIGSFVPAHSAQIALTDQIFVRSGASDGITAGLSTFMVEMVETAHILHQATDRSLVILDEIGRGTSTFDGISIAWAVAVDLVTRKKRHRPKTLFATHYHELQALESEYSQVKNYSVAVSEESGEPVFLHLVEPGPASHSYGIAVAKLAGIPKDVVKRAQHILHVLEKDGIQGLVGDLEIEQVSQIGGQQSLFGISEDQQAVLDELSTIDINTMTPLEAMQMLAELQKQAKNS